MLEEYAEKLDELLKTNFKVEVLNSHIARFDPDWQVEHSKYSGSKRIGANYVYGVGRIVKSDGSLKEGTMQNGAWHGLSRVICKGSVTYKMNLPGRINSEVKFVLE